MQLGAPSVPDQVVPAFSPNNDTEATIVWSSSRGVSDSVVRYIVNVRQYFSDGDGKVRVTNKNGYPLEVPSTILQHMVTSLGMSKRL